MKKIYEYKVELKHNYCEKLSPDELDYLNNMGKEGWELVNVMSTNPCANLIDNTIYYWKRVKL